MANELRFEIKPGMYLSFWFTELGKVLLTLSYQKGMPSSDFYVKDSLTPAKEQWDECLALLYKCNKADELELFRSELQVPQGLKLKYSAV